MTRRLMSLAALGLAAAPAAACPPLWLVWVPPPVVYYRCPPPVVFAPCPLPLLAAPPVTAPTPAAPPPARVEVPAAPKSPPRVEADPTPFRPAGSAELKPADPPTLAPLVIPTTPPPKPAAPLAVPLVPAPADPKAPDLKPVSPGGPDLPPLPLPAPRETRTSLRVAAPPSVRLVPAAGPAPADPATRRRVVFVNLTAAAVRLTVEGESATLPARHELTATVPARFRWRLDDGESRTDEVPVAAPGAEVVLR